MMRMTEKRHKIDGLNNAVIEQNAEREVAQAITADHGEGEWHQLR